MISSTRPVEGLLAALLTLVAAPAAARADAARVAPERSEAKEEEAEEFGDELVWIDARGGYTWLDMVSFAARDELLTAGLVPTSVGGGTVGMGLGLRLWFVTIGPRATVALLDDPEGDGFNLWSLDGEVGLRIPLGRVEPHLTLAAGYSAVGGISDAVRPIASDLEIEGANVKSSLGVDVYITPNISVGADVAGEVLVLSRPGVPLGRVTEARNVDTINDAEAEILEADGSSVGGAVSVLGGVGFHF